MASQRSSGTKDVAFMAGHHATSPRFCNTLKTEMLDRAPPSLRYKTQSSSSNLSISVLVPPGDELTKRSEIVVRSRRLADEVGDPGGQIVVELVELRTEDLRRALDLLRIPAHPGAPLVEDLILARQLLRLPLTIPDRGVLRDDAQGHLLPATADEDRQRVTNRSRVQLRQPVDDHRHVPIEIAQARGRRSELVAVLLVVSLMPAAANTEDEATAGDVVERARHVCE